MVLEFGLTIQRLENMLLSYLIHYNSINWCYGFALLYITISSIAYL